jgi:chaperone required for assembly of F1-ATPase
MSIRRRYKRVAVAAVEPAGRAYSVLLDDQDVLTPARKPLTVTTRALAEAIAGEWEAQGDDIDPRTMPLTRLACTGLDRVEANRQAVAAELCHYGETDLLCYRAPNPAALADRQHRHWQPVLDWLEADFGVRLVATSGVVPIAQPEDALDRLAACLNELDSMALVGVAVVAQAVGSIGLAMALFHGRLDAESVWHASLVDEMFQVEQWGEDAEASARRQAVLDELRAAERYLKLLGYCRAASMRSGDSGDAP